MKSWAVTMLCALAFAASPTDAEPAKRRSDAAPPKPLTYANVVSFFKEARFRPIQVQKRCTVFFEGEFKNANVYNYCLIVVENSDEDIQVTFYLTDAHEMNWVTEFLDAPFFAPAETKRLFGLMNSRRDVRGEKVGRFRVDFHRWEPRHAQILVFSFTRS
ncbi:MAG TPA: hypothetical protein VEX43_01375 [Chthoniobacterales bacterium]|nr:hypothetical protein [Chthoniobacterales bacterium]